MRERALQLPAAIRDARRLRTLALLDLESHPPPAAIDRVVVAVDPTPERVLQYSLLARPLPNAVRPDQRAYAAPDPIVHQIAALHGAAHRTQQWILLGAISSWCSTPSASLSKVP